MFTVTRATAATTHLSVTVGVAETQRMIFNGVPDGIDSARWPTRVDILANATAATFLVVTDDDDVDETDRRDHGDGECRERLHSGNVGVSVGDGRRQRRDDAAAAGRDAGRAAGLLGPGRDHRGVTEIVRSLESTFSF